MACWRVSGWPWAERDSQQGLGWAPVPTAFSACSRPRKGCWPREGRGPAGQSPSFSAETARGVWGFKTHFFHSFQIPVGHASAKCTRPLVRASAACMVSACVRRPHPRGGSRQGVHPDARSQGQDSRWEHMLMSSTFCRGGNGGCLALHWPLEWGCLGGRFVSHITVQIEPWFLLPNGSSHRSVTLHLLQWFSWGSKVSPPTSGLTVNPCHRGDCAPR